MTTPAPALMLLAALLGGCGADVATTAATGAAVKKQDVEAAQENKARLEGKLDQAVQAGQQRAEQQGNPDGK